MPTQNNNQIIGLIRFSFPALSGFAQKHDSPEEMLRFLYDPARLERRFKWFEKLCLPSLQAQSDTGFETVVLTGQDMPSDALAHLCDLVETLPHAAVIAEPPRHHYNTLRDCVKRVADPEATWRTTFRLDDDDALDTGYVARLRGHCAWLAPQVTPKSPMAIAYNRGFYVDTNGREVFDATERLPLSVGTALMTTVDYPGNIYARNHRHVGQFFNLFTEISAPGFIRAIHGDNDSNPSINGRSRTMDTADIKTEIDANFATSYDELLAL